MSHDTWVKIHKSVFATSPKCVAQALEQYRQGDVYIFQTTYTCPHDLPKFNPDILRAVLLKNLHLWQYNLDEAMGNSAPPLEKSPLKREIRRQLAKLCFAQHYGLITPEYIEHFKLHDPEDSEAIRAVAKQYIDSNPPSFKGKIKIPEEDEYFALRRFL
ncbi:hypothetical protein [Helicobacter gastrocanis]|uniref:hypothetical protein n=1 Tax=Helicobacter gastrocanis TaxID=2849641 RepID=UPI0021A72DD7|nr:hypothetical protein [Helicobacter sp. NHP19-003]